MKMRMELKKIMNKNQKKALKFNRFKKSRVIKMIEEETKMKKKHLI